jgi:predicted RecB family nuclease
MSFTRLSNININQYIKSPYIETLNIKLCEFSNKHKNFIKQNNYDVKYYKKPIYLTKNNIQIISHYFLKNCVVEFADYNDYHNFIKSNDSNHYLNKIIVNFGYVIIFWFLKYNNHDIPIMISSYDNLNCTNNFLYNSYNIDNKWAAASKTRNYLMDDPINDYLEYNNIYTPDDLLKKNKKRKYSDISDKSETFLSTIFSNGIKFENEIIKKIKEKFNNDVVTIMETDDKNKFIKLKDPAYNYITLELIKKGIPIIYQAILHDPINKIYGMPDLIIRADYINKLFDEEIVVDTHKLKETGQLPYYIVDIKNSTIHLSANSDNILNNINCKPYKGQIAIYYRMLSQLQNYNTNKGFILASKWSRKKRDTIYSSTNPFDRLGIIDFNKSDSTYLDLSLKAIKWIQEVKDPNNDLNCLEPNNINMYPNMCNHDPKFNYVKNYLATKNHEITNIWMCGPKHRTNALKNGIDKWSDSKLNSQILGFSGKIGNTIDLMLKINNNNENTIYPNNITSTLYDWRDRNKLSFYIDFETLNPQTFTLRNDENNTDTNDIIFMIGVGYSINNEWNYKCFIVDDLSNENQIKIINNMFDYIKIISQINNYDYQTVNLYHWSQFEPNILSKLCTKYNIILPVMNWADILKIFHEEPIIIKGALNFSLKTVGKALNNMGLIKDFWIENSNVKNGLDAMFQAYQLYQNTKDINENEIMKEIIKYNEIDCSIMWEILNVLDEKC